MAVKLKKLKDQVIVITGASSGIGLATALMAGERGAKVVLAARRKSALQDAVAQIREKGGEASFLVTDVTKPEELISLAHHAVKEFGRIDTWVNNAGLGLYCKLEELPTAEGKQVFEVNFWGIVNGCKAALPHLKKDGGALINLGSVVSERVLPIQGMYAASKHAIKAYNDALRMELEADGAMVSVTLVRPAAINTPFIDHAVNHLEAHPTHLPPVYAPEVVAEAILAAATSPQRDVFAGGAAKMFTAMEAMMPRVFDVMMEKLAMDQTDPEVTEPQDQALTRVPKNGQTRGTYRGHTFERSLYTSASLNKGKTALIAAGLGFAAFATVRALQNRNVKVM